MSFLKRLFGGSKAGSDDGLYLYVRCNRCKEPIRIRINPSADLSPVYAGAGDDPTGYETRKEILGNRCYNLIQAEWRFDRSRRKSGSDIQGGTEITAEDYEAETAAPTQ